MKKEQAMKVKSRIKPALNAARETKLGIGIGRITPKKKN